MREPCPDLLRDALASGRSAAISELYDRFGRRLFRTAWGMLGRQEDAEDAVQEVFVDCFREAGAQTPRVSSHLSMFVYTGTALISLNGAVGGPFIELP